MTYEIQMAIENGADLTTLLRLAEVTEEEMHEED